jgi:membrane-associated protease RseP (regulator of RpoE activity)
MMRFLTAALLFAVAGDAWAQGRSGTRDAFALLSGDPDRAMIGVGTTTTGRRDTLGLYVSSVTSGGPAEKAGIEEGNRLVSINGVNLKLSREDAEDAATANVAQNRLVRELRKVRAGDEVTLEVWSGGRTRSVRVKTVAASELQPSAFRPGVARREERAAIGVFLSATGTRRDTTGVFVSMVIEGGPAEKAGIVEGDRIASVNDVDVRVPREDAGDARVAMSRLERLEREIHRLKPGDAAELVVISGGRSRTVRVTTVKESELPGGWFTFRFGDGRFRAFTSTPGRISIVAPGKAITIPPKVRIYHDGFDVFDRHDLDGLRFELEMIGPTIREESGRELPKAMEETRRRLDELRVEVPKVLKDVRRGVIL